MAITNLYPNLPAHLVQFKDGGLTSVEAATGDKTGKSLLLLGTAVDGPIMEPVQVSQTTVAKVFGDEVDSSGVSNGTTLTKYAKQAFKCGFHDVRCMRVTGTNASVKIVKSVVADVNEEDVTQVFSLPGCSADTFTTEHKPIVPGSLVFYVDDVNVESNLPSYGSGSGTISVSENFARAYAKLTYDYNYANVTEKTVSVQVQGSDEVGATEHYITKDQIDAELGAGESLYFTDSVIDDEYRSNGFAGMILDETDTAISDDNYDVTVAGAAEEPYNSGRLTRIEFDDAAGLSVGDTVKVKVYVKTIVAVTGEERELPGSYDGVEVAADRPITAGSLVIEGKTEGTDYTVSADGVTFLKAGKWRGGNVTATYTTTVTSYNEDSFIVNSIYGGTKYNGSTVEFKRNANGTMRVIFTKSQNAMLTATDAPFYYDTPEAGSDGVRTVGQLRDQLENYSSNNVFDIVCDNEELEIASFPEGVYTLTGATNGVNPSMDDMFEALSGKRYTQADVDAGDATAGQIGYLKEQGAYQLLENYNVDFIIPLGVYADVVPAVAKALHTSFHQELAMVCAVLTYRTKMTHGFIDVKPCANTTLKGVEAYVQKLLTYDNVHYMTDQDGTILVDSEENKMDIGWYTSCVVGPDPIIVSDKLGKYYGSSAIAYAALCSSLKPESAPTNKKVPGAVGLKYTFSNKQLNELVGNKFVVFKTKNANTSARSSTPYVVDGCTSGAPNSDYGRISTVKVVTDVVDQIREVCEPFLGEPNTTEQRNAMSALISKRLAYLLEQGEIQWYEFQVDATIQEVLLGECSITLTLVVPQELRKITTTVALRASS
jgi:hypothetical protein